MYKEKSILAVVPARGGSKGIKRKNIVALGGKPLIAWTIDEAKKSKYIDRLIVSTEDLEIAEVAKKNGAEVPFLRPKNLAKDETSTFDTIIDLIHKLEAKGEIYDYLLLLQPTSPFRTCEHIDVAIRELIDQNKHDALISICELEIPLQWIRHINSHKSIYKHISYDISTHYQRQSFDTSYRLNGALYIINVKSFKKHETFEPEGLTMGYVMSTESSIDIDEPKDLMLAEHYIEILRKEKTKI